MNRALFLLSTLLVILITTYPSLATDTNKLLDDPFVADYVLASPDTIPLQPRYGDFINDEQSNPFDLKDPAGVTQEVEYDPISNQYIITEKIGEEYYRMPTYMSFREYLDYRAQKQEQDYFNQLSGVSGGNRSGSGKVDPIAKVDVNNTLIDRLFGGTTVDIKPQGNIELELGLRKQRIENPTLPEFQANQNLNMFFDMNIQVNVEGKIGEKLNLATNFNSEATFNFDNQMKLDYNTDAFSEDEIIKKIEAGNVSLPLRGTLIQGSQNLFGLKTELQFGHLRLTAVASQQQSQQKEIVVEGGSQFKNYEVYADEYDENRHFFLSHYNRNTFEDALSQLPVPRTLFNVAQLEVWITNDRNVTTGTTRQIVAISDLGEPVERTSSGNTIPVTPASIFDVSGAEPLPYNDANNIFQTIKNNPLNTTVDRIIPFLSTQVGLQQGRDFEQVNARKLEPSEYTFNEQLGFISLNINVRPDQVVAVGYSYTYNGDIRTVGELANATAQKGNVINENASVQTSSGTVADTTGQLATKDNVLVVKMLKSTIPRVDLPMWDLMMKNFYSIGAYQVNRDDFTLDIFYDDPGRGPRRFLPKEQIGNQTLSIGGEPLLFVLGLDTLNVQLDPQPDGVFDFVENLTIYPNNGRIMFPKLEPFGSSLAKKIEPDIFDARYVYQQLYDSTVTVAREYPELNRFAIRGSYRTTISSEISLGAFNIPPGSEIVNGGSLKRDIDYTIDYATGRIRILNEAILNSGTPIRIRFEDNALFGFNQKAMIGLRADYQLGKKANIGATYLQLSERPFTQKVNINDDPINNRIYGLDFNFDRETPWLTKAIDALPLISTKAPSSISFTAEAAALKPGHARAINQNEVEIIENEDGTTTFREKRGSGNGGTVYVDDFEGSASNIDLRIPANKWVLASVPRNDDRNSNPLFPEAAVFNSRLSNINRAHLNWYSIDNSARNTSDREENPYTSIVQQTEVFRNAQLQPQQLSNIRTFDLTYYPKDRGSYNFEDPTPTIYSRGMNPATGELNDPETRWAGIMREVTSTQNFEAANVESIQFWMLSPFIDVENSAIPVGSEGDLYFNLGNVSEDILYDGKPMYERALPGTEAAEVEITELGRVPSNPPRAAGGFDNSNRESIIAQDVGLDGANDSLETVLFQEYLTRLQNQNVNANVLNQIAADPSKDNYTYYNDNRVYEEGSDGSGVFERYYNYNHTQGNSQPAEGNNLNVRAGTQIPDSEDINEDNSLNTTEAYWQYKVPIRRDGDEIDISSNPYIVDRVVSEETYNGKPRYWYRFKIPLTDINRKSVGGIQDFRSIRFIRMYLHGFQSQTTLRFARLELVRNQWRTYTQQPLSNPDVLVSADNRDNTTFDVTAINIEQNSDKQPFPYVLPLGIQREQSIGVFNTLQNEQSLALETCNLSDGDARAIYKLVDLDLRVYERIKMFVHAEQVGETAIPDGATSMFIRLGSDFNNNYYEYEIPLIMSDTTVIANMASQDEISREIWKAENELDFPLRELLSLKLERNQNNVPLTKIYEAMDSQAGKSRNRLKVKGNPNLGYVRSIMIGVRNIDDDSNDVYCSEVWINELRLSGLDEQLGLAATSRVDVQLADLGNLTMSGNLSTIGFGSLEQSVSERQRESITGYDVATNLSLDKFLPPKSGVKIPFYAQYSNTTTTPEYDPYDLDVVLAEKLAATADATERSQIKEQAQTRQTIKSIALTNVRKERTNTEKKPLPWDISNFSLTYARNQIQESDPIVENAQTDEYRGAVDYAYSRQVKYIEPLKKVIKKDKYLKFLSQINFNPIPNSFSFNTVMDRQITQTSYRLQDIEAEEISKEFRVFYNKYFTWDRNYNLQWDLTKNLKFNFNAAAQSIIDELPHVDFETRQENDPELRKEFILDNIRDFGRPKNYQHQVSLNYTLPFKYFPFLDWVNVKAQYNGNYNWAAASLNAADLGNVIQNQQTRSITGDFNLEKLYNYSKYLKKINNKPRRNRRTNNKANSKANSNKKTSDKDKNKDKDKKKKKGVREPSTAERIAIRPLMSLRRLRFNYRENFQTVLPGFRPEVQFFGQNDGFQSPGWDFVAGLQPRIRTLDESDYNTERDWLYGLSQARVEQGLESYIVDAVALNSKVSQNYTQDIDAKVSIEPFSDVKLDLEASRQFSERHTQFFKDFTSINERNEERQLTGVYTPNFERAVPINVGSVDISYFALNTFWQDSDDEISALFDRFESNRVIISRRLGVGVHENEIEAEEGFTNGYGRKQQDVLLPAFLAAYTQQDASTVAIGSNYARDVLFKELPRINWRFSYNGLSKIPFFKRFFQNLTISHGYRSNLSARSFETNTNYLEGLQNGQITPINDIGEAPPFNFYSRINIPELVIQEQFAPLLAFDMRLQNDVSLKLDFKKSRSLAMNSEAGQLNETQSEEYTVGFGYRIQDFELPFGRNNRRAKKPKVDDKAPTQGNNRAPRRGGQANVGDLDIKFDFSLRDNVTFLHELDDLGAKEPTRGERTIRIDPQAIYQLNDQLSLTLFFSYNRRVPRVSTSFPITNSEGGVRVSFALN